MAESYQGLEQEDEIVTVALDSHAWIRVTVLISFAVTVVGFLMYLISGGGRDLFQRKVMLRTYVADGSGLEKKAIVEVNGIKIGKIASVELSHSNEPSRVVRVNFLVQERYLSSIPVDSRTEVTADNLLGDKYINIRKGVAHEAVKAGDELFAEPPSNTFDPADLIASLQGVLNQISSILDLADDPESQLGQLFQSEALYDQVRGYVDAAQETVYKLGNPKSPAGQAIFGSELYEQLLAPILDIDKRLAAIQSGEGPIGHAYATTEQYDKVRDQIAQFRKSVAELRTNKLLTSDEMYQKTLEAFKNLNTVITSLSSGPLFANAQLYESLNGSSKSAEKFLKEFRNDPRKFLRVKIF
jgi:phospholipid/cholesterol/gamma-HCH transport system substrate-binding protein